jgi:hypothetical protein
VIFVVVRRWGETSLLKTKIWICVMCPGDDSLDLRD